MRSLLETLGMSIIPLGLSLPICDVGRLTYHTGVSEHIGGASFRSPGKHTVPTRLSTRAVTLPPAPLRPYSTHSGPSLYQPLMLPRAGLAHRPISREAAGVPGVGCVTCPGAHLGNLRAQRTRQSCTQIHGPSASLSHLLPLLRDHPLQIWYFGC